MARQRQKRTKRQADPVLKMQRAILPSAQVRKGDFVMVDVANHSEGDQRHSVRSGETKTIMRKSWVERLVAAKVIEEHQAKAVQWYADQHEAGFATVGCTANYGGAGGGGFGSSHLFARYREQQEARDNYQWARTLIPADLLPGFEMVVLNQARLNGSGFEEGMGSERTRFRNRRAAFRLACDRLHIGVQHIVG